MSPAVLVKFFKEAGTLRALKVPKALNPSDLRTVRRPPNVAGNNTSATMGKQKLTKSQTTPLPSTP
jgi:hypothetical protein